MMQNVSAFLPLLFSLCKFLTRPRTQLRSRQRGPRLCRQSSVPFPSPSMRHSVHIPFPCTTISIRCFLFLVREIPPPPLHPLPSASCSPTLPFTSKRRLRGRAAQLSELRPSLGYGGRPDFPGGGYGAAPRRPGELHRRAWP